MRICIKFVVHDLNGNHRTFVHHTDRPYPEVPKVGTAVTPDDTGQLAPRDVERIVYEPDGGITLLLDPGLPTDDPEAFIMALQTVGFDEEDPRHLL